MNRKKVSSIVAFTVGTFIFVVGIAHTLAVSNLKESLSQHSTLIVFGFPALLLLMPIVIFGKEFALD